MTYIDIDQAAKKHGITIDKLFEVLGKKRKESRAKDEPISKQNPITLHFTKEFEVRMYHITSNKKSTFYIDDEELGKLLEANQ